MVLKAGKKRIRLKTVPSPAHATQYPLAKISDVARMAGVSIATVSYVLNGIRKVSPATQNRVLSAIRELGYSPNVSARNLVAGQSNILGLIVSDLRNPFFPEITTAFQDAAQLSNMEAIVMNTNYDTQRTINSVNRLFGLQVRGVAILTSEIAPSLIDMLARKEICAVYLDLGKITRYVSNIVVDYEQGMIAALEHIRKLGHTRIGFIGGALNLLSAQRRKHAILSSASKMGSIEIRTVDSDFTVEGGYFACAKMLSGWQCTALIAANDLMAIGAMHCVYDRGISVPKEMSIIGFDDITFAQFTQPSLTTVAIPRSEIGSIAFAALSNMLSDAERQGREYRVKTDLIIRNSTAACE